MLYNTNARQIIKNIGRVLIGKEDRIELAVIALLSEGHLLLEDVPGVGKTTLANALAKSLDCGFSRIQFTPDTLPSDVTGLSIYNIKTGAFEFSKGAVMNNIVLADEINRTSPKTQASLLEAMQERQVTVDNKTYRLEAPFMVIATQNPIDFLGTYNLPEAQLDRFLIRVSLGYPELADEVNMARQFLTGESVTGLSPVANRATVLAMQEEVRTVGVIHKVIRYAVEISEATRQSHWLTLGASPRATLALIRASQACADLAGRDYVLPDDIQKMAPYVLCHRFVLTPEARIKNRTPEMILEEALRTVSVPIIS